MSETNSVPQAESRTARKVAAATVRKMMSEAQGQATKRPGLIKGLALTVLGLMSYGFVEHTAERNGLDLPGFFSAHAEAADAKHAEPMKSFTILSAGKTKDGKLLFLNDKSDYKASDVYTVVIDTSKVSQHARADPRQWIGKKVTAYGPTTDYKGKPQTFITDGTKVKIE